MCFSVFDEPKINFHKVFGGFLVPALTFSVISINILSFDRLSPIDGSLIHFGVFYELIVSLGDKLKNFWIFAAILQHHFKGFD